MPVSKWNRIETWHLGVITSKSLIFCVRTLTVCTSDLPLEGVLWDVGYFDQWLVWVCIFEILISDGVETSDLNVTCRRLMVAKVTFQTFAIYCFLTVWLPLVHIGAASSARFCVVRVSVAVLDLTRFPGNTKKFCTVWRSADSSSCLLEARQMFENIKTI